MIETIYVDGKQVICDNCGDGFEADNWDEALDRMLEEGWQTQIINHEWVNYCPDCIPYHNM